MRPFRRGKRRASIIARPDRSNERTRQVADNAWFEVQDLGNGITALGERLREGTDVKSYLVEGDRDLAVIDTGTGVGDFAGLVAAQSAREPLVLQTHGHWDHI